MTAAFRRDLLERLNLLGLHSPRAASCYQPARASAGLTLGTGAVRYS